MPRPTSALLNRQRVNDREFEPQLFPMVAAVDAVKNLAFVQFYIAGALATGTDENMIPRVGMQIDAFHHTLIREREAAGQFLPVRAAVATAHQSAIRFRWTIQPLGRRLL